MSPPDNISLKSGSFFLNGEHLTDNLPLVEIPDEPFPQYIKSFNLADPKSAEFAMDAEIDIPMFNKLAYTFDASKLSGTQSMTVQLTEPYQKQRRKHKKKRINKKWAKRYGYVTKFRDWRIKEVSMVEKSPFEFELTGRDVEFIKM